MLAQDVKSCIYLKKILIIVMPLRFNWLPA